MNTTIVYQSGIPESCRASAARLYDLAFGRKIAVAIPNQDLRLALLEQCFNLDHAVAALHDDQLVGIAGFHTATASLTSGMTYDDLKARLGPLRGAWAGLILSLYERKPKPGELVMDGIAVDPSFRGQGIGGRLLDEIKQYGRDNGYYRIRLDVVDTNPRARDLYTRKGFRAVQTETFHYLRWLLGFGGSTTMEHRIEECVQRP